MYYPVSELTLWRRGRVSRTPVRACDIFTNPCYFYALTVVTREMLSVVVVACVLSAVSAKYCCTPPRWEGDVGLVMGSVVNQTTYVTEVKTSYM